MHQILCSGFKRWMIRNGNSKLPEDIIHYEILPRVPAISLVPFRLVCKFWNSLFSDSKFVKSHLTRQHSSKDQDLLICKKIRQQHEIIIVSPSQEFHIPAVPLISVISLGSINGLVCMASRREFCLWNPATGQVKEICLPSQHAKNCKQLLGFSWDHVQDDYKVVSVCYVSRRYTSLIKVHIYFCVEVFVGENDELRQLPSLAIQGQKEFNFVNINDNLYGMAYKRGRKSSLVEESHCGVWSKIQSVGPISLCTRDWWLSQCFKNGEKVLIVRSGTLSYYDLKTQETKFVNSNPHLLNWCFNYTPSPVRVQGMVSMHEFFKDQEEEVEALEGSWIR